MHASSIYTLLIYKYVSILYMLPVCQTGVCVGGAQPPFGRRQLFLLCKFSTTFCIFLEAQVEPSHPHYCVYIFYKFGPSLVSISQSVLTHLAWLSRRCLCFSYFSSSSSSSTSHLQPQHFTIPLWLCRRCRRGLCSHFLHFSHVSPDGLRHFVGDGSKFYVIHICIYVYSMYAQRKLNPQLQSGHETSAKWLSLGCGSTNVLTLLPHCLFM